MTTTSTPPATDPLLVLPGPGNPGRPPYAGRCWICGDLDDHDGRPHAEALGDGLTRRDVVDLVNTAGGRQLVCSDCGARLVRRVLAYVCGHGQPGPVYSGPLCPTCQAEPSAAERAAVAAARSEAALADAVARGVINP